MLYIKPKITTLVVFSLSISHDTVETCMHLRIYECNDVRARKKYLVIAESSDERKYLIISISYLYYRLHTNKRNDLTVYLIISLFSLFLAYVCMCFFIQQLKRINIWKKKIIVTPIQLQAVIQTWMYNGVMWVFSA